MISLGIFALVMIGLAWWSVRKGCGTEGFFVYNRQAGAADVGLSIVASCVGGSATLGMAGLAWQVGTPAFWWLGSGAVGLMVLTLFLARTVRQSGARTMPEMIVTFIGAPARPVISVIIILAWLAIAAAQFSAMAAVITSMTGLDHTVALLAGAVLVVVYAGIGGQAAIFASDGVQYGVLVCALGAALCGALSQNPDAFAAVPLQLVNADFSLSKLQYFLCILGGSYVVCPMLFGRLLSARSSAAAVRGSWGAVIGLCLTAVLVVAVGLACRGLVPAATPPEQVLTTALVAHLPAWLGTVILLGVFSAIISSADSCLITAATVCSNDILHRTDTRSCRLCLVGIAVGGVLLALSGRGILQLLLMANDIYVCGVVAPVFVGMVLYKKCRFSPRVILAAILGGGAFGLTAALTGESAYSYTGVLVAFLLAALAARPRRDAQACCEE